MESSHDPSLAYAKIQIGGGDTAKPLTLEKRMAVLGRYIRDADQGKKLLDCGCGSGEYVLQIMRRFRLNAIGVEYLQKKVDRAALNPELKDRVEQGDLGTLRFASNTFDFALLNEVLEHVPDELVALKEISRVLKPGGLLFLFSPNRCFPIETHGLDLKHNGRRILLVPFVPYIPLAIGRRFFVYWARNYWPWELFRMVAQANFKVLQHGSIALTFENISTGQPFIIKILKPLLRVIGNTMEKLPILKHCGASQFLICQKNAD